MSEWTFSCGGPDHLGFNMKTLLLDATDEADANEKARAHGWVVDWDGPYPGVACSKECWQKSHDEWERRRPAREAVHRGLQVVDRPEMPVLFPSAPIWHVACPRCLVLLALGYGQPSAEEVRELARVHDVTEHGGPTSDAPELKVFEGTWFGIPEESMAGQMIATGVEPILVVEKRHASDMGAPASDWKECWRGTGAGALEEARERAREFAKEQWVNVQIRVLL